MRSVSSCYDRRCSKSTGAAHALLDRYEVGEIIEYDDLSEADLDDMGYWEVIRPNTKEVPGEGYRRIR